MLTENTECSTLQRRRDAQGNTTHREGSEKLAIYTRLKQNRIHLLPKTKCGGSSINHDKKGWDSWAKRSLIAQTTMRNPHAHQRLHAFQLVTLAMMCHRPHMAPTTSATWEPPQQTHHALKATNLTSKLRQITPKLEATPSLTNLRLVLGTSAMTQTSLLPTIFPAQPAVLRVDVDRKLSTLPEAHLAQRSLGGKAFGPSPRPTQPFCSSSPWFDRQCWPEFGTLLRRPQAFGGCVFSVRFPLPCGTANPPPSAPWRWGVAPGKISIC